MSHGEGDRDEWSGAEVLLGEAEGRVESLAAARWPSEDLRLGVVERSRKRAARAVRQANPLAAGKEKRHFVT